MLEVDRIRFTSRAVRAVRAMTPQQRLEFLGRVLRADPQLEPGLNEILVACDRARRVDQASRRVIRRDSIA